MEIVAPHISEPVVDKNGIMTDVMQRTMEDLSRESVIVGTGSPEGVVEATVSRLYMDNAGVSGSILYIKRDADIAGDRSKGWIAV